MLELSVATSSSQPETEGPVSAKLTKLLNEKKAGREFQIRKHSNWNDNYDMYRGRVKTNRLTQRQPVNIPLMKETIKTMLSRVDDPPSVKWTENSGDGIKELVYQEIWDKNYAKEELELKDILDKKNVLIYGLSTKMLNLKDDGVGIDILDPFNIVFDPQGRPLDVESCRFVVRQNIFKRLRDILVDDRYSEKGKDELKLWLATDKGIVQSGKNKIEWEKSMQRLRDMGVQNDKFPVFAGGDVIVNLTEHYTELWNQKTKSYERRVVVYADDTIELMDEPLIDLIGVDLWPFDYWSEDPETNDIYPDSVADLVRDPNKIINVWFSQQVENRTLQNFQMHWFDATVQGYQPQTYEPGPGRMLPAPGDPNKTILPVAINGLDETFTAIDFLTNVVERGTGATAIEKGEPEQGVQTLGEVKILVGKAAERSKTMAKFYRAAWYRVAKKWDAMMQANSFPKMQLYKTGSSGKVYEKTVYNPDWKSKAGYEPNVASSSEQEADQLKSIQKFSVVLSQFPDNEALKQILLERELKSLDLTSTELLMIKKGQEEAQKLKEQQMKANMGQTGTSPAATPPQTADGSQVADPAEIESLITQLTA